MNRFIRSVFSFENLKAIILAIAIATLVRSCAFELFRIPSGSMKDTLLIEDVLVVSKYPYGYGKYSFTIPLPIEKSWFQKEPQRGDIIVFRRANSSDGKNYIKRLIGLPGETINVVKGVVYIDGVQVKQEALEGSSDDGENYKNYIETLPNGCSYHVKYSSAHLSSFPNVTPKYEIPAGYYFFMGDNRDHSIDSRYLAEMGFILQENLIGRADIIAMTAIDNPLKWMIGRSSDKRLFSSLKCN